MLRDETIRVDLSSLFLPTLLSRNAKLIPIIPQGGQVKTYRYSNIFKLAEKYGPEAAVEFASFEAANVAPVKALVEKENIDCDFHPTRTMDVYLDE